MDDTNPPRPQFPISQPLVPAPDAWRATTRPEERDQRPWAERLLDDLEGGNA